MDSSGSQDKTKSDEKKVKNTDKDDFQLKEVVLEKSWAECVEDEMLSKAAEEKAKESRKPVKKKESIVPIDLVFSSRKRTYDEYFNIKPKNVLGKREDHQRKPSHSENTDSEVEESTTKRQRFTGNPSSRKSKGISQIGICTDEVILARRTREIDRAKEKEIYKRYVTEVPKIIRKKGDPKTPNKLTNYSRRSWDKLLRLWKRSLYVWGGEAPSDSCVSSCESASELSDISFTSLTEETADIDFQIPDTCTTTDAMASLLDHFAMDSRTLGAQDNSTLKAPQSDSTGPKDFAGSL